LILHRLLPKTGLHFSGRCSSATSRAFRPGGALELTKQRIWDEARTGGIDVPVARRGLAVSEEALRHDEVQIVLGARHRDIKQPALFLDLVAVPMPRSEGMQPSTTFMTKTDFHSWPLAEWIVDRIR
jgi:hypothetical protein